MWTPRRIVLLVFGFAVFFGIYLGYGSSYIGRIDGLPPLPDIYLPNSNPPPPPKKTSRGIEEKLVAAFGPGCQEVHRALRLELHSKSLLLAAGEFKLTPEGEVLLTPISLAMYGKDKGDGRPRELNIIRGNIAYLTFDKPVSSPNDLGSRKVTEAKLEGNIEIISNRRRAERDQDLRVHIATGPLFYSEPKHKIWTNDVVSLKDYKPKPHPHQVKGKGMVMELLTETPQPPRPGAPPRKSKGDSITGVKQIVLHENVHMDLYIDGKSGFLGGQQGRATRPAVATQAPVPGGQAPPPEGPATEPSHVHIHTPGRFTYDIFKDYDVARFQVPEPAPNVRMPEDVTVIRHHPTPGIKDQLICQDLELRIRRKDSGPVGALGGQQGPGQRQAPAAPVAGKPSQEQGLEIDTAHAMRRFGKDVVLTSDTEKMEARGHDFFYDAKKALTILKGEPRMEANKDGSIIIAREMRIRDVKPTVESGSAVSAKVDPARPEPKPYQEITAQGPGEIHMMDKASGRRTTHAFWNDTLVSTKDGPHDMLTLTGDARFMDEKDEQSLKADTLKVWLEPTEKTRVATPANASPTQSHRPQHLEATGKVVARSRDMNIHDTTRLVIWFKDVPVEAIPPTDGAPGKKGQTAGPAPAASGPAPAGIVAAPAAGTPARPTAATPVSTTTTAKPNSGTALAAGPAAPLPTSAAPSAARPGGPTPLPAGPTEPAKVQGAPARLEEKPKEGPALDPLGRPKGESTRPIDLSARSVEAWVLRSATRSQLDKLWTEGDVHVRQDPARPEEKDTDIRGDTLQMTYNPAGNFLVVTGDLAQLRMDKIYILGPEVNIDQATNKAWVHGVGAMQMESATNFQGQTLEKSAPLTVHWNKSMFFNGESAEFHGGIQAEQEKSRLACQHLQVYFDKAISLKQGGKGGTDAKVRNLVCDRDVRIEETTYEGDKLKKYDRIEAPVVQVEALEHDTLPGQPVPKGSAGNMVRASGPGNVRLLQYGSVEPALAPAPKGVNAAKPGAAAGKRDGTAPGKAAPPAKQEELKLTYVAYQKRMDANSQKKTAYFYENVRVLNMPCNNPNTPIDLDVILSTTFAEGTLYLRCDRLRVLDQPENGKPNQQMEGHGNVYVQGKDFYARADSVYYNQAKDQVIFDGKDSGQATLYKIAYPGANPTVVSGKKILYRRSTGETAVEGTRSLEGEAPGR